MPPEQIVALLQWYADMGVDVAIADEPLDRFAESAQAPLASPPMRSVPEADAARRAPAAAAQPRMASPAPTMLTTSPDAVELAAREQARSARTLDELRDLLERFDGCALKATANRLVFADGAPDAKVMFVGEAPGRDEDIQGRPFVGRSGQLLDRMLTAIGLDRTKAYIANVVPWRPPGNRDPTPQETTICRPFIERQIELVAPKVLVCLGARSAQALLGVTDGILKLRGRWLDYDLAGQRIRAIATLHPAYLLRQPVQKRLAWRDFRAIRTAIEQDMS
ncbi:uracil-DNA glycosylase [Labrys sp. LIt4]|uniref:Type-4 uracil-DNA glycosylase n=1 Tax=Labrys okinawensis TaxID=346911 RepID=A0A2S9QE89_9HYPH|nr:MULTISPECIES: uracil-DNA glycosylase [Labrys]MBP0580145.1 uracil-DNA glycosylase [Labrys sp. LIt4]PRH87662.1 uracil-DNA glycosylase [Labrys okinawensis]